MCEWRKGPSSLYGLPPIGQHGGAFVWGGLTRPFLGQWGRERAAAVAVIQRLPYRVFLHVESCRWTDAMVKRDTSDHRDYRFMQIYLENFL